MYQTQDYGKDAQLERDFRLCACGCGRETPLATQTRKSAGRVKGRPCRYVKGHSMGGVPSPTLVHGLSGTSTYSSWLHLRDRCRNPNNRKWHRYGGRGITVCSAWDSFEQFLADMGERPEGTSIDRVDNEGNYEPGNCRWATPIEQAEKR